MQKLLILTEAGDGIGYGHFSRCSAIRDCCEEKGIIADMKLHVAGSYALVAPENKLHWLHDEKAIAGMSGKYDAVLVDSYKAPAEYFGFLKSVFKKVVVIDDYNRIQYACDIVINPNIFGTVAMYGNTSYVVYAGEKYVILRKPFRDTRERYTAHSLLKNVLITLGGSDIHSLLPLLIERCSEMYNVTAISGNDDYRDDLKRRYPDVDIHGFTAAEEMVRLMLRADAAVSACGQTLHELAYLNIPTVGICIGNDQVPNMKYYNDIGFLKNQHYWHDEFLLKEIQAELFEMHAESVRSAMAETAARCIDGKGVENIVEVIFKTEGIPEKSPEILH
jgi:spore coat polysaccharide biosynthesis predicted glycosyltransferase SpsG